MTDELAPPPPSTTGRTGTVLLVPPLPPQLDAAVAASYRVLRLGEERAAFLHDHAEDLGEVVALVCTNGGAVDERLISALPRLGMVANHGVGYDNVDLDAALGRGVAVSHTPHVLDDAVAEIALALLLAVRRQIVVADRFVRDSGWESGPFPLTDQVAGSRVGILGLGRIGRAVATRLEAFGAEVSYHNRRPVPGVAHPYAASPRELAAGVDSLIVVVPGGSGTTALVDADVLEALGPEGVLVNVARGSVVDEQALVEALATGRLGGAGLDVVAHEPHVPEALRTSERVVLLPHLASGTHPTRAAMRRLTQDNLDAWMRGEELLTPIPEMG